MKRYPTPSLKTISLLLLIIILPLIIIAVQKQQETRQHASETKTGPDLDVTYIERTPKYYRYSVTYANGLPVLVPGTENQKHWPDVGEQITYTAHIINKGISPTTQTSYHWTVNGQEKNTGSLQILQPNEEAVVTFQNLWPETPQTISFSVDTSSGSEISQLNNALTIGSHDLTITYWAERGVYDMFNNTENMTGSFSFEDWVQAHIAKMNERFSQAIYPAAPNGIRDRVRIDKFTIVDEIDGGGNSFHNDSEAILTDGKWQASDGDATNTAGRNGNWQNYVNTYAKNIDWGLNHEVTHQLGVIDLYRMNIKNDEPASPNGGITIRDINNQIVPVAMIYSLFTRHPGEMGGGDTTPYNDGTYYENHTAGGLNSEYLKRRGFFGSYLFDTPQNNAIRILDKDGNPIANATVALYQKDYNTEDVDNIAEITATTDANGVAQIPNKTAPSLTTANGHTLKDNPFGKINVSGQNGTMIAKIDKDNKEGYGLYFLYDLNVSYWSGNTTNSITTLATNYPKVQGTGVPTIPPTIIPTTLPTIPPTPTPTISPTDIPPTIVKLPADVDSNGCVDIRDFNVWLTTFKTNTRMANTNPDIDNDGTITIADFNLWLAAIKSANNLCQ